MIQIMNIFSFNVTVELTLVTSGMVALDIKAMGDAGKNASN